ncbi:MAG: peptidoglycan-binding protein [Candidatus Paceibacterota bacterium]
MSTLITRIASATVSLAMLLMIVPTGAFAQVDDQLDATTGEQTTVVDASTTDATVTTTEASSTEVTTDSVDSSNAALAPLSEAQVVATTTNTNDGGQFDSFNTGSVNGQGGWTSNDTNIDEKIVTNTVGPASFGLKAMRVSNAKANESFDQMFAPSFATTSVGEKSDLPVATVRDNHFEMSFDFASTVSTEQPGLAITLSPDRGDGSRMSYIKLADTPTGVDVIFYDVQGTSSPVTFVPTTVATGLDRSVAHNVKLTFDAVEGPSDDIVKVYVDGNLVHTGTSWENYYRYDAEASAEQTPRVIKTVLIRANGTPTAIQNRGFLLDHVTTAASYVPVQNVYVSNTDSTCFNHAPCYSTIAAGIAAVDAGGVVHVAPGTYVGGFVINKAITLKASGTPKAIITGVGTTSSGNALVKVRSSNVTINGFTIIGGTDRDDAIAVGGAAATLTNVEIENTTISSFGKRGVHFTNTTNSSFHDSEVIGDNVDGTNRVQDLVSVWGGSSVEIYNNNLHNALTTGTTPSWTSPAIQVTSYGGTGSSTANIHDNQIYSSDTGIVIGSVYATGPDTSSATITKNVFHDLVTGISFESASSTAVINEDSFTNVTTDLASDSSVLSNPPVNADRNWWGVNADPRTNGLAYPEAQIANWYIDSTMTVLNTDPVPASPLTTRGFSGGGGGGGGSFSSNSVGTGTTTSSTGGQVLGAAIFNFIRNLHIGLRGTDVTELQTELIAAGYSIPAGPTGYFGTQTRSAVAAWQKANGVAPAVGFFGPISRAKYVANGGFGSPVVTLPIVLPTTGTTTVTTSTTTTATSTATTTTSH